VKIAEKVKNGKSISQKTDVSLIDETWLFDEKPNRIA